MSETIHKIAHHARLFMKGFASLAGYGDFVSLVVAVAKSDEQCVDVSIYDLGSPTTDRLCRMLRITTKFICTYKYIPRSC